MVLGGFAGLQLGRLRVEDIAYLLLNAVGSGLLLVIAIIDREWGFILLEGTWAGVSLVAIARRIVSSPRSSTP